TPAFATTAPAGLTPGSIASAWFQNCAPIRLDAFGSDQANVARPAMTGTNDRKSGLMYSVQLGMPNAARSAGRAPPAHCVTDSPLAITAPPFAGTWVTSSTNVAPVTGNDVPLGASCGTPAEPGQPAPIGAHRATEPGVYSQVSARSGRPLGN